MNSPFLPDKNQQTNILNAISQLAKIFWGPDPESCRAMLDGTFLSPFEALGFFVADNAPGIFAELKACHARFADPNALFEHLEALYINLFINNRNGVIIPLYASCHTDGSATGENASLMGPAAVEMKKRFKEAGLALGDDIREPPDHVSIELEYLYFMLEKGWSDNDRELIAEASSFSGEIMLPWFTRLQDRLAVIEAEDPFYRLITVILDALLHFIADLEPIADGDNSRHYKKTTPP